MIKGIFMKLQKLDWVTEDRVSSIYMLISLLFIMIEIQACFRIENFNYLFILFLYLLGILLYKFYMMFLKNIKRIAIFTALIISLLLISYFRSSIFAKFLQSCFIDNFIEIQTSLSKSSSTQFYYYIPYLSVIVPICISIIKYLESKFLGIVTISCALLLTLYLWYLGYDINIKLYLFPYMFVSIAVCGGSIYKRNAANLESRGYRISILKKSIAVQICICTIIITSLTVLLIEGVGVKNIFEIADQIGDSKQNVEDNIRKNGYNLAFSGYGKYEGKLGGPVALDNGIAFRVKGDELHYLRGAVKDYYDGFSWKKSNIEYVKLTEKGPVEYSVDFKSYMLGINSEETTNENLKTIKTDRMIIYPETLYSPTLFTPNLTYNAGTETGNIAFDDAGVFVLLSRNAVRKPYYVDFFVSSTGVEFLTNKSYGDFGISYSTGKTQSYEEMEYYENHIIGKYDKYLELPDNISQATYKLVESLTGDCQSSTQKVQKIREYLLNNYKYSLDMPLTPKGREFVDYFLFTEKEGYCTYFATAAAIMCRIAGIPSRYVEGFCMEDRKDSDGLYIVTNDMAHAWTEVLLSPDANLWTAVDAVPLSYENIKENYVETMPLVLDRTFRENSDSMDSEEEEWIGNPETGSGEKEVFTLPILYIPSFIVLTALFYLLFSTIRFRRKLKYIMESESIIPLYIYSKKRLQSAGIKEHSELDDRKLLYSLNDNDFRDKMKLFLEAVYEEFYSKHGIVHFEKNKFYIELERFIRKNQNSIKYYIKKYLY